MSDLPRTLEEQVELWKSKCLNAEKELKREQEITNQQKLRMIELHGFLSMWKNRAEQAEKQLKEYQK